MRLGSGDLSGGWLPSTVAEAAAGHVVVVAARTTRLPIALDQLWDLLSDQERQRVDRLQRLADRANSIVGTAIARTLLAEQLRSHPRDVPLLRSPTGKPLLAESAETAMHFSIAHSGDLVLVALYQLGRVGIDVELVRQLADLEALTANALAARERDEVSTAYSASERLARFYRAWTRKEAMAKALGIGLSGLDRIVCDTKATVENALLELDVDGECTDHWTVTSLAMPGDEEASVAVAYEGQARGVVLFAV